MYKRQELEIELILQLHKQGVKEKKLSFEELAANPSARTRALENGLDYLGEDRKEGRPWLADFPEAQEAKARLLEGPRYEHLLCVLRCSDTEGQEELLEVRPVPLIFALQRVRSLIDG